MASCDTPISCTGVHEAGARGQGENECEGNKGWGGGVERRGEDKVGERKEGKARQRERKRRTK